ncbi:helix-turn-helix domain-containing protein [Arthrobacter sp. LAPM80]|uniref:MarR family transcriptional regulator n=1 Tax=Arthrobacter sp. LAPM80 TaxID=3141788 RepID=UPI00398B6FFB
MFVLTIDQRGSRTHGDKVPQLLEVLAGADTAVPFDRSVGDEVQGVMVDADAVVGVVARVLRLRDWYIGIGIGGVDVPLPSSSREGSGDAFISAREAVEAAKKMGERVPLRIKTQTDSQWAEAAEAVLALFGDLVRKRSGAEWRVLDALEAAPLATQKDVAAHLGISPQAVSKAITRSGRLEEANGRRAAALLLRQAQQTLNVGPGS